MNATQCYRIFERFRANNPKPTTELQFDSPFELLIAVMLSAQATDISVNKATQTLFREANTPEALLHLGEEGLKAHIKTIGLYNSKARHIMQTCALLLERHQSQVPSTREDLEELPGVGRKTANVVLNTAFGKPTMAVDTHIFRVANRIGLATGTTPLAVELGLLKIIDPMFIQDAHHWLILHGRYVCLARKPRCESCLIRDLCEYPHKNS
jgi:endonuclease-3